MKMLILMCAVTSWLSAQSEKTSMAVLPFENVTGKDEHNWLCRGFAEEVTSGLASVPSLAVVERTQLDKVIREQDFHMSDLADQSRTAAVGKLLSAKKILAGSFQIYDLRILVLARIIDVNSGQVDDGHQFRFEDDLDNIFDLYAALTHAIVQSFSIRLTTDQSRRLERIKGTGAKNIKAYQSYVLGMEAYQREDVESLKEARDHFKKALRSDKKFTLARQALANAYIKLDELDDAIKEYEKIRKTGVDVTEEILNTIGLFYTIKGRKEKALEAFHSAVALNSGYAEGYKNLALLHYGESQYDSALDNLRLADRLEPENPEYVYLMACCFMKMNRQYEAMNSLRSALEYGFHDKARIDRDNAWDSVRFSQPLMDLLEEFLE